MTAPQSRGITPSLASSNASDRKWLQAIRRALVCRAVEASRYSAQLGWIEAGIADDAVIERGTPRTAWVGLRFLSR